MSTSQLISDYFTKQLSQTKQVKDTLVLIAEISGAR